VNFSESNIRERMALFSASNVQVRERSMSIRWYWYTCLVLKAVDKLTRLLQEPQSKRKSYDFHMAETIGPRSWLASDSN
jgi:hypothetical protein